MVVLCLIFFEEPPYCFYFLYVVRRGIFNMHTNIDIKSSQFMSARVHSFTLSIHLLNTCHVLTHCHSRNWQMGWTQPLCLRRSIYRGKHITEHWRKASCKSQTQCLRREKPNVISASSLLRECARFLQHWVLNVETPSISGCKIAPYCSQEGGEGGQPMPADISYRGSLISAGPFLQLQPHNSQLPIFSRITIKRCLILTLWFFS